MLNNIKALCWDVTVICPLADSYISAAARDAESAAERAASRKKMKYPGLDGRYRPMFAPIAFENLGVASASTRQLLSYLGRRLTDLHGIMVTEGKNNNYCCYYLSF